MISIESSGNWLLAKACRAIAVVLAVRHVSFITIENEGEPGRLIETGFTRDVFGNPTQQRTEAYVTGRFG